MPPVIWKVYADTGGTFTDCLAIDPQGRESRAKVLSNGSLIFRAHPVDDSQRCWQLDGGQGLAKDFLIGGTVAESQIIAHGDGALGLDAPIVAPSGERMEIVTGLEAPLLGAHLLTATPLRADLPAIDFRLATTRGTNALLEKRGARIAFFVNEGFGDLLRIGDQTRPDLFSLAIEKPQPLHEVVVEVAGRLRADGSEESALRLEAVVVPAKQALARGIEVACVALLHSDRQPAMEHALASFLKELGFRHVVTSAEVSARIHFGCRAETALVDAYLMPVMEAYLNQVQAGLGDGARLRVMTSAGGLVERLGFRAKDSLLSGPAGGVVGAAGAGRQVGWSQVLGFDMGGTSTDVSRYAGEFLYQREQCIGDARLQGSALRIETVAAGGGSICRMDRGVLKVGPESAGASPGPACYGAGGPLTLTDVHALLGRLDAEHFAIPLDVPAAQEAFDDFLEAHALDHDAQETYLQGFLQIANERMADAIRLISLREGHDPSDYALVAFGGAGGLHACALAELLGIHKVLAPRDAGILSARGLQLATLESEREQQILQPWRVVRPEVWQLAEELIAEAGRALPDGVLSSVQVSGDFRFVGQESALTVPIEPGEDAAQTFQVSYRRMFGHDPGLAVELVTLRVRVKEDAGEMPNEIFASGANAIQAPGVRTQRLWCEGAWQQVPVLARSDLDAIQSYAGPALIGDGHSTLLVDSGWQVQCGDLGSLRLTRLTNAKTKDEVRPPEVEIELFTQRFRHVVQVMGDQLKKTALSTNVKERLDYSCCLLDAKGRLIANAPHIPVHLGAMGLCVRRVMETIALREGDVILTNHPAYGGSHLPDLTVIMPVFHDGILAAVMANRAHHAEIGGIRPGSMPPGASDLEDEGVILEPVYLFDQGEPKYDQVAERLLSAKNPTRAVSVNLADLRAQVAACRAGAELWNQLIAKHGLDKVSDQLGELYSLAAQCAREVIGKLRLESSTVEEWLDDGTMIRANVTTFDECLRIDFTGTTGPRHLTNLNATPAIVRSAVMYVMRLLQSRDLPLNEGLLDGVDIVLPECFLNPDFDCLPVPAVVGGNVETSQRLVDTLLKAFDVAACSQGTMNNLIFGNDTVSYYETICGGAGAGPDFNGASAVHTHMTNTAITDPEILERRYPVRLRRFSVRARSGGAGTFCGGDGVVRELEFLEPVSVSLLTQHRQQGPYGMHGGKPGQPGGQRLIRAGKVSELPSLASFEAEPGDRLVIETPGGGGWGDAGHG